MVSRIDPFPTRIARRIPYLLILASLSTPLCLAGGGANDLRAAAPTVTPQGILQPGGGTWTDQSPQGSCRLEVTPLEGDFVRLVSTLRITTRDGTVHELPQVRGQAFLATDAGCVVVIESPDSNAVPSRLSVIDFSGRERLLREVSVLTDPAISSDGMYLAYRCVLGVVLLDLRSSDQAIHPNFDLFAAGSDGILAGVRFADENTLALRDGRGKVSLVRSVHRPRKVSFARDDSGLFVMTDRILAKVTLDAARVDLLYTAPDGAELRDLRVGENAVYLGQRTRSGEVVSGRLVALNPDSRGKASSTTAPGVVVGPPVHQSAADAPVLHGGISWPLQPDAQHPIGNTYGEYQDYGGSPYMHPGIDVLGSGLQPVYAVAAGVVKAVLTTSGSYHWRVAVGDSGGSGTVRGYLYAHLDQGTIAVNVGDTVVEGQYLGGLVPWPSYNFTHCHFARVEDSGSTWYGNWLCPGNPHVAISRQSESSAPVFLPARGSALLAFCNNQTSQYRNPNSLTGAVDIVARIGDTVASGWVCTVQKIRYTIYPVGSPESPVVDNKLAVSYDMALDTYSGGPIDPFLVDLIYKQDSTCRTLGDYNYRDFFYIITNSDGNEVYESSDLAEAWNTSLLSDGDYVIEVTAIDASHNATTQSMTVTTNNGNP